MKPSSPPPQVQQTAMRTKTNTVSDLPTPPSKSATAADGEADRDHWREGCPSSPRGVPVTYRFEKHGATLEGTVAAGGYVCCCAADAFCGYRGKVLSALQFEKHAGAASKNQNGHIFLPNGASLYELFHALRGVPAEQFAEAFRMAAGVPMTVLAAAAAAAAAAEGAPQEVESLAAEQPPGAATLRPRTVETLTEEEKASLSLLGLRASGSRTETNPMGSIEGHGSEAIENAASSEHAMADAEGTGKAAVEQPRDNGLSTVTTVEVPVKAGDYHAMPDAKEVWNADIEPPRDSGLSTIPAGKVQVTAGSNHGVSVVKERRNADVEQSRDSDLSTTLGVKFQVTADNDHAMPDVQDTRNPILEQPWHRDLSIATPVKVRVTETKYRPDSILKDVRGLLSTGLLEGFRVTYKKNEVERIGRIVGQGYACGCVECGYRNIMNACEFEQHSASFQLEKDDFDAAPSDPCSTQSSQEADTALTDSLKESTSNACSIVNWNIFKKRSGRQFKRGGTEALTPTLSRSPDKETSGLSTGTSMKSDTEETLSDNTAGPLNTDGIMHTSAGVVALKSTSSKCDPINMAPRLSSPVTVIQDPLPDHNVDSNSKDSGQPKVRDNSLHPMLFKEGGLPDFTLLTYKLKNGEILKQGYKRGQGIVCDCCHDEFTPSHFEDHAGMGRRRQPYRSIYTSDGFTLHELALKLQDGLNSNTVTSAVFSTIDELPTLTSSGSGKESLGTSRPIIVPLKRTLQRRVDKIERCYLCGDSQTILGVLSADMIVFCNQCERACHVKCYNNGLQKSKSPLKVLEEYVQFNFLCCEKCQLLRASLDQGLKKCEEIASHKRTRSSICWQLLSGMNMRSDLLHQVIDIFKDAFAETDAQDSDLLQDMVNSKDVSGEKDFRGIYCAVLTASTLVVSAALLKVRTEEVAELVLVATRNECRKKGYFALLLRQIEAHLKDWNVHLLTAPVDPEMASIWSEKLGYTLLSDEQESLLEAHPLVSFENLSLVQKSLAGED